MLIAFRDLEMLQPFCAQNGLARKIENFYSVNYCEEENQSSLLAASSFFESINKIFTKGKDFYLLDTSSENSDALLALLVLNLPNINSEAQSLWQLKQSWGACFDVVNASLDSDPYVAINLKDSNHDAFVFGLPHNYICEKGDSLSDFSLDGGLWTISIVDESLLVNLSSAAPTVAPTISDLPGIVSDDESEISHDWEIIDATGELEHLSLGHDTSSESAMSDDAVFVSKTTYKDAVLRSAPVPAPSAAADDLSPLTVLSQPPARRKWTPQLVVTKTSAVRLDREYGSAAAWQLIDDDDDGVMDLAAVKYSTSLVRKRNATMMPPKIKEKKEQRILEKAKA